MKQKRPSPSAFAPRRSRVNIRSNILQIMPEDPNQNLADNSLTDDERPLFVYGTLRRGGSNDIAHFGAGARLLGAARVRGALYDLGAYPGMVLGGSAWVWGELYAITQSLESRLDRLEEVWPQATGEYRRSQAMVMLQVGHGERALSALIYALDCARAQDSALIEGGDWIIHVGRRA